MSESVPVHGLRAVDLSRELAPAALAKRRESGDEDFDVARDKSHLFRVVEPFM
jgi:hypothetical protein